MKVFWTEQAVVALEEIQRYVAQDNPGSADKLVERILNRGENLSTSAKRGRIVPETRNPEIRELIVGNYRLIYRISEKAVHILTVFEGHRRIRDGEI